MPKKKQPVLTDISIEIGYVARLFLHGHGISFVEHVLFWEMPFLFFSTVMRRQIWIMWTAQSVLRVCLDRWWLKILVSTPPAVVSWVQKHGAPMCVPGNEGFFRYTLQISNYCWAIIDTHFTYLEISYIYITIPSYFLHYLGGAVRGYTWIFCLPRNPRRGDRCVDKECPGTPPRPREARGRRGVETDFRNKNGGMMGYSRDIVGNDITPWVIIPSISYIYITSL